MLDPLKPYLTAAKWVGGVALALALVLGGRSLGVASMTEDLAAKDKALHEAGTALRAAAGALRAQDAANAVRIREAAADAARAAEGRAAAEKLAARHADAMARIERELADALKDPDCRRILELKSCAIVR